MNTAAELRNGHPSEGWMGRGPIRWLEEMGSGLGEGEVAIEVGSWKGRSTSALASRCQGTIYAVDHWAGVPDDPEQAQLYAGQTPDQVFGDFQTNLAPHLEAGRVVPLRMDRLEAAAELRERHGEAFASFVFIDADHRYRAVRADILAFLPLLRPGGILSGHDMHWPGVARAVRELVPQASRGPGSIWYWRVAP
jgi:hypothetical protein